MWSPTKLDFLFYDFSVIYYDFSNIQRKETKRQNVSTVANPRYCSKTAVENRPEGKIDGFG
jgi:hypothetical protein